MYDEFRLIWTQLCQLFMTINILAGSFGSRQLFVSGAPIRQLTYNIDMSDPDTVTHLSAIVDSLESLDVLDKSHASCYTVDKIVKSERLLDPRTWIISVNLYVQELQNDITGDPGDNRDVDRKSPTKACPNVDVDVGLLSDGNNMIMGSDKDDASLGNYTSNGTLVHFIMDNVTTIPVATGKEKEGRLSRTQIMVISTCSTVIGLFFLVALAMRIRNYMKRYRAEQQNRRSAFRSNSSGLRGSDVDDNSPQSVNPPIMVPPVPGRRPFHIDGRSNDVIQSSLRRSLRQDHKPLLIVTSASAPSSPAFHRDGATCVYSNPNTGYKKQFQIAQRSVNGTEAERDDISQIMHGDYNAPNAQHSLNAQYTDTDLDNGYYSAVNLGSPFGVQRDNESREKLLQEDEVCGEINVPATIQNDDDDWSCSGQEHGSANELQVYTIGHSGLTQSDSSITSSRNPPYVYGNQCEYQGLADPWITEQMADVPDPLLSDPCQQPDNGIETDFCDDEQLVKSNPDSLNSGSDTYQQQRESESGQGSRPLIPSLKCRKTSDSSETRAQRKSVTFSTDGDDVCQIDDLELVDDVYDDDDDDGNDGDDDDDGDDGDDDDHQAKANDDWFGNEVCQGTNEEETSLLGQEAEALQPSYI